MGMHTGAIDPRILSRRGLGLLVVAAVHILFVYVLIRGLAHTDLEIARPLTEATIIEEIEQPREEPPPPPPRFVKPPPAFVPPPEIRVEAPAPSNAITQFQRNAEPSTATAASLIVPPQAADENGITQPEYPPASQRLGEIGTVVLALYVREDGSIAEAKVDSSSGFERLDNAAIDEALRAWRFKPGTKDGKPFAMWHKYAVRFKVEN